MPTLEKQDYKFTEEFGYIPSDWEVSRLGNYVTYFKGYAFKSNWYTNSGRRIIRVSDMAMDSIGDEEQIYIYESEVTNLIKYKLCTDDVVITTVGSKPPVYTSLVGRAIRVQLKDDGSLLNQNAVCLRSINNLSQKYLFYIFKRKQYLEFLEQIIRGNANQGSITLENLWELPILLPPLEEQERIAEVLGDIDGLIEKTQQLINKKKDLKTATMQKLLTPKEDWEEVSLSDITKIITKGTTPREFLDNGNICFVKIESLSNNVIEKEKCLYISDSIHNGDLKRSILQANDILFGIAGALGKCCIVSNDILPANTNQALAIIRLNDLGYLKYIFYVLQSEQMKQYISENLTVGAQPNLSLQQIADFKLSLPDYKEQHRIASILSDMDSEIEALEQELSKYQDLKTGMMQDLLTGKVRLK